ncbi:hypothetical protein [Klebsiella phage phiKp_21]|nr:hypothetical protein [Klebsiella phage phiKp_21]
MKNIIKKDSGGYSVVLNGIVIGDATTMKEARNMIAQYKRKLKYSNLVHKYTKFSNDFKSK